jgi:hypothetical protein
VWESFLAFLSSTAFGSRQYIWARSLSEPLFSRVFFLGSCARRSGDIWVVRRGPKLLFLILSVILTYTLPFPPDPTLLLSFVAWFENRFLGLFIVSSHLFVLSRGLRGRDSDFFGFISSFLIIRFGREAEAHFYYCRGCSVLGGND